MDKTAKKKFLQNNYASVNMDFVRKHLRLFPEDADVRLSSGITMRQMVQCFEHVITNKKN